MRAGLVSVLCAALSGTALGQDVAGVSVPIGKALPFCFISKPKARCDNFGLIETGVSTRAAGPRNQDFQSNSLLVSWDVGAMHNVSPRAAVGLSWFAQYRTDVGSGGLRLRARWWFSDLQSFDVAPGVVFLGGPGSPPRPSAFAAFNQGAASITATILTVQDRYYDKVPRTIGFIGIKLGEKPGSAIFVASSIVAGFLTVMQAKTRTFGTSGPETVLR